MTLVIHIGRRVPKSWFRRQGNRVKGLLSFQENLWMMINQSLRLAKKKANASGTITFVMTKETESEDLNYDIKWVKIVIQGTKEQEEDEYNDTMKLYGPLNKVFKKDFGKDDRLSKHFKSKILTPGKIEEAYKQGYGAIGDDNLAQKMLEMGILTHIDWIDDFENRDVDISPDFGG